MEKGWNNDYLISKKENLLNKRNIINKNEIEEDIELIDLLMLKLLFKDGEVIEEKITFSEFFDYLDGAKCSYKLSKKDEKNIYDSAKRFLNLPKLEVKDLKEKITVDESLEILKDFFKDKLKKRHYDVFENTFIKNKEYVLYDKNSELSKVIYVDDEIFTLISKTEDVKMISSIAHETGHIYKILSTKNISQNYYGEYESFYFEFNLLLWLIKNNIYKEDATSHFLSLFKLLEQIIKMRYFIYKYNFDKISNEKNMKKMIINLDLKDKLNIKNNQELYNLYITTLEINLKKYFYSFLAVLNNLEDKNSIRTYENVLKNLDKNESYIKRKILSNKNEMDSYLKYRSSL